MHDEGRGGDLIIQEVKGVCHGWTQFPDSWISEEHKKLKLEAFRKAREFLQEWWHLDDHKDGPVEVAHDKSDFVIEG